MKTDQGDLVNRQAFDLTDMIINQENGELFLNKISKNGETLRLNISANKQPMGDFGLFKKKEGKYHIWSDFYVTIRLMGKKVPSETVGIPTRFDSTLKPGHIITFGDKNEIVCQVLQTQDGHMVLKHEDVPPSQVVGLIEQRKELFKKTSS